MIQKVSLYFILPMAVLAFFLAIAGVEQVQLGDSYYTFIGSVGKSFEAWKLEIPDIPNIPNIPSQNYDSSGLILQVLIKIANFFVGFLNIIIYILNLVINLLNIVIQLIQFILTLIYQCKDFIDRLRPSDVSIAYL